MDKSVVKYLEAPVGTIKLSEAMRIGAKIRPQAFLNYFIDGKSCALSAAYEGVTGHPWSPARWAVERGVPEDIVREILGMNDISRMSRERIADWLEAQGY